MKYIVAALAFILAGVAVTTAVRQSRSSAATAPEVRQLPQGHEQPIPGATFVNGYNVADIGPCAFQARYAAAEPLLGPPVGPFTGRSQDFLFGRLVCAPGNPSGRAVLFDDLGMAHLRLRGIAPQPGSEPHPAVRSHILNALETGLDPQAIFGRVISPAVCDRERRCSQYTDRQRLDFDDAPNAQVVWAPLGCLLNHACQRAMTTANRAAAARANRTLLGALTALGVALAGAGVVALARRRAGGRFGRATI